jgi:hypothetical protein
MTGHAEDAAIDDGLHGHHISPAHLPTLIENLKKDEADLNGAPAPGLQQLMQAAQEARASDKSLLLVKDHAGIPDAVRAATLNEETNHAAQRAATGSLDTHLKGSASGFVQGSVGSRAVQFLEQNQGYRFRSPNEAASEVGVRLMQPGQYQQLGLSRAEGHALATEYMRSLKTEYGHAAVSPITGRITDAFR